MSTYIAISTVKSCSSLAKAIITRVWNATAPLITPRGGVKWLAICQVVLWAIMIAVTATPLLCTAYMFTRIIPALRAGASLIDFTTAPAWKAVLQMWAAAESVFYLYYCYRRLALEKMTKPPDFPEIERRALMRRVLRETAPNPQSYITGWFKISAPFDSEAWRYDPRDIKAYIPQNQFVGGTPTAVAAGMPSGVDAHHNAGSLNPTKFAAPIPTFWHRKWYSYVRSILPFWMFSFPEHAAPPFHALRTENIIEFFTWAFFSKRVDKLSTLERDEIEDMTTEVASAGNLQLPTDRNPHVSVMRLTLDTFTTLPRPIGWYAVFHALELLSRVWLRQIGFTRYHTRSFKYWYRAPANGGGASMKPVCFFHGMGVGLFPYIPFLSRIDLHTPPPATGTAAALPGMYLVELPFVSMEMEERVPTAIDTVADTEQMLNRFGYADACFVGHSFGTICVSWLCTKKPQLVAACVMIDPVVFVLWEHNVCYNFMYRTPQNFYHWFLHFITAKELYISNTLRRHFWWFENVLLAEQLPPYTAVFLSGADSIVPAAIVNEYLQRKKCCAPDALLFYTQYHHAEFLAHADAQDAILRCIITASRQPSRIIDLQTPLTPVHLQRTVAPRTATKGSATAPPSDSKC